MQNIFNIAEIKYNLGTVNMLEQVEVKFKKSEEGNLNFIKSFQIKILMNIPIIMFIMNYLCKN